MRFDRHHVHDFLQFVAGDHAEVDLHLRRVVEVHVAGVLGKVFFHAAAGLVVFGHRCAAERQLHGLDFVLEDRVLLRIVEAFFIDRDDLSRDAAAGHLHAGDIEHGRIGFSLQRMRVLDIRVVDVAFRDDPADKVDRALAAGGSAEGEKIEFLSEIFAKPDLDFSPVVRGNEEAVLYALRRAGDIGDDAADLSFCVFNEKKFDAVVAVAFDLFENGGVRVAPHLRGTVTVHGTAAVTDRRAAEGIGEGTFLTVFPGFYDRCGDALDEERIGLRGRDHVGIVRDRRAFDIFAAGREERLQDHAGRRRERRVRAGALRLILARIDRCGVGVDRGDHDLHRVKAFRLAGDRLTDRVYKVDRNGDKVAAYEYRLLRAVVDGESGHRDRLFYIFRDTFGKLACQGYFFVRSDTFLGPTEFQCAHNVFYSLPFFMQRGGCF